MRKSLLLALIALGFSTGCYASKIVTVPMRVAGAVTSAVPIVGNTMHDAIDTGADVVDGVVP